MAAVFQGINLFNLGVSSEGEKSAAVVDEEEGREAEASEAGSSVTTLRRSGTARRSARSASLRGRARAPPTRIVWEEDPPTSPRGRHSKVM